MRRLLTLLPLLAACASSPGPRPTEGGPQLELPDVRNGETTAIPKAGRVTVLDLWAVWCEPCVESLPLLDELATRLGPEGVDFYAVSIDESAEDAATFAERHGLKLPVVSDPYAEQLARWVEVSVVPTSIVLDCQGRVRHVKRGYDGPADLQLLEETLLPLLSEPSCQ